jgi:hypothetical protein
MEGSRNVDSRVTTAEVGRPEATLSAAVVCGKPVAGHFLSTYTAGRRVVCRAIASIMWPRASQASSERLWQVDAVEE